MAQRKVISMRMDEDLMNRVRKAAKEDFRSNMDQVNYLVGLGLKTRDAMIKMEKEAADLEAMKEGSRN
ncbi:transcriptional repressor [Rhodobacteraceae phage LS06-2018-MD07]|jgi:hypothetical protein|nr:transcriptional repressor [Rhodobacteraceae phage LS06-2018-MD07]